ncbi:HdeD family acid-resistance protein [Ramlibacter humi]|uniref:HdeD family acid-resistance protein n=1 Tax=Ramlibacter humi TaxID=2530451 RepID=A0A4Z0BCC8_9BURK|nr:HdeD family acid-resistance protein [Ramlibacter humi]TFY96301.1 HdeD family acid-resistance protein [Ramlibacter humi]
MATLTGFHLGPESPDARRAMGSQWKWLVLFGVLLVALGVIAFMYLPQATEVSVYIVGICMLIGAAAQLALAIAIGRAGSHVSLLLSALLYGVAGALAVANPAMAAQALTLWLAFMLIFSGATRFWWSFLLRTLKGWGWITASAIVSVVAGIVLIAGWPANAIWLPGMVLSIDLMWQGATAIGFGVTLRQFAR